VVVVPVHRSDTIMLTCNLLPRRCRVHPARWVVVGQPGAITSQSAGPKGAVRFRGSLKLLDGRTERPARS